MKKLIDDTIGINIKDLEIFLELLAAYGNEVQNPYVIDASHTLLDFFRYEDEDLKSDFERWSDGQIKFK